MEKAKKIGFRILYADGSVSEIWDPDKQPKMFELKEGFFVSLADAPKSKNWHESTRDSVNEKYGTYSCRMPTGNEWRELYKKKPFIDDIRQQLGFLPLSTNGYYWASTTKNNYLAEVCYLATGWVGCDGKMGYGRILYVANP